MATDLTLGEYHQRRNALLRLIRDATKMLERVRDPNYTPLSSNGDALLSTLKSNYEQQLVALNAAWNLQQFKKENR